MAPLSAAIEAAFRDAPQPAHGEPILQSCDPGSAQIMSAFEGKAWHEVKPRSLLRCGDDPMFQFTPRAFVYYLQAYMQAMIADPQSYDHFWEMLVLTFTPNVSYRFTVKRISLLSERQCLAVVAFLDAFAPDGYTDAPAAERGYEKDYRDAKGLLLSRAGKPDGNVNSKI